MMAVTKLRVKLPVALLDDARTHGVDLSRAAEAGVAAAIKTERDRASAAGRLEG